MGRPQRDIYLQPFSFETCVYPEYIQIYVVPVLDAGERFKRTLRSKSYGVMVVSVAFESIFF